MTITFWATNLGCAFWEVWGNFWNQWNGYPGTIKTKWQRALSILCLDNFSFGGSQWASSKHPGPMDSKTMWWWEIISGNTQKLTLLKGYKAPEYSREPPLKEPSRQPPYFFIWQNFMRPTNLRLRPYAGHLPGRPPTEKHIYLTNGTTDAPMCVKARGNWPRGQIRVRPRHDFLPKDCPWLL